MKVPSAKKLPSGKWRCQIQIEGKRYSVTGDTRKEAERLAAGIKAGYAEGQVKQDSISLTDAITAYCQAKKNVLSPSTLRGYTSIQDNRFSMLMDRDIFRLTTQIVQIAVNEEARTLSPKTVHNTFGLIHSVLKFYGISMDEIKLPQRTKQERSWMQSDEISKLLAEIDGDKCEIPILLAVWLGLRRSEILGLCWDCVDLERNIIVIRRAYVYGDDDKWHLKDTTKASASQRVLHLPDYIADRFRKLTPETGRVFAGFGPELPRKHLIAACQRAGITVTHLHGLRHTFAAVMLQQGVNERIVMRQGGWSSNRTMREIYDYIMDEDARKAQEMRDSFFDPSSKNAHENAHETE